MPILRQAKKRDFTAIDNYPIRDNRLSLKALGLLLLMVSRPDDWRFNLKGLAGYKRDGLRAVRSALDELRAAGYVSVSRERCADGTLGEYVYTVREVPTPADDAGKPT